MYKKFKYLNLKTFLWKIVRITIQLEFDQVITDIRNINSQVIKWLFEYISMKYWVELYFKEYHYNHFISNIIEFLNAWILEIYEKLILIIFKNIYYKLMNLFIKRWESEYKIIDLLILKSVIHFWIIMNNQDYRYYFEKINFNIYKILSNEIKYNYIIDLE